MSKSKPKNNFKGIIDTTLRDGQQSPLLFDSCKYRFTLHEKKQLVHALLVLGVRHFEFFSPVVSDVERNDFFELKEFIQSHKKQDVQLLAHVRCHENDIQQAIDAGFDGLNLFIGIGKRATQFSHGLSLREISTLVSQTVRTIRKNHPNLYIRFSMEDSFRTPLKDVYKICDEIAKYVNTFGIPDTVGIATPQIVKHTITKIKKRYPDVDIECHFHNDRGYALVNAVTAVLSGASYIDAAIWGLAERSGITSVTGLLYNLFYEDPAVCEQFNLSSCYPVNVLMGSILNMKVPYNEPVSLTNRTHIAGVHQKAVLNNSSVYEGQDLKIFGVNNDQLLLGPLSGWNLVYYYLREVKLYDLRPKQAQIITKEFKKNACNITNDYNPEVLLSDIAQRHNIPKFSVKQKFLDKRIENLQ